MIMKKTTEKRADVASANDEVVRVKAVLIEKARRVRSSAVNWEAAKTRN